MLAATLRPGNAGSNTTADHIAVLTEPIAQVPPAHRKKLLIRTDGAGASHRLLDWLTAQDAKRGHRAECPVGFAVTNAVRDAIALVPKDTWSPASDADGDIRDGGDVVDLTGLLDLGTWPAGMRVLVRRERPSAGTQLSCSRKPTGGATRPCRPAPADPGVPGGQAARPRPRLGVPPACGGGQDPARQRLRTGPVLPREFTINQTWTLLTAIAADLVAWLRLLALTGDLAKAEPKTLRYRVLHVPARLTRGARRRRLHLPKDWPWARAITEAFAQIMAIPMLT